MARTKTKGIKWQQVLTWMSAVAKTLTDGYATKKELRDASGAFKPTVSGSTLVFPEGSSARVEGSTLVLVE